MDVHLLIFCFFADVSFGVKTKTRLFPPGFMFGASTAAYQIEGGALEGGKGSSIWDEAVHRDPSPIKDFSTGDISADSYHLYKEDVQVAFDLGLDFYRFSISWPRILPSGFADNINQIGIQYYNNLIDDLLDSNIQPMVTMYHWDLPSYLQKFGGWTNPLIIDWFASYAKILFDTFGDKVKYWITINDPKEICYGGYGTASKAPMANLSGIAEYMCAKNVLLAHARVYHLYDEVYRLKQGGSIGIAIGFVWYNGASDSTDDQNAAVDARMFEWGLYANPIFTKGGDYPMEVKKNIAMKSAEQGWPKSRLPELFAAEVAYIRGSSDFLGVNSFTTRLTYRDASLEGMYPVPSYLDDVGAVFIKDSTWKQSASKWLQEVPWGFYKLLTEIRRLYDNPPIFITANGWSTKGSPLDEDRIHYMRAYLSALLDALYDGSDIKGYSYWSLIDNFEWLEGYTAKFGLYEVDYLSPHKLRSPRKSAYIYKEICKSRKLDVHFEPEHFFVASPPLNSQPALRNDTDEMLK